MEFTWKDLDFWQSGEWQVIEERLSDLDKKNISYNPGRAHLFAAMDAVPFEKVKVILLGQDPYPNKEDAMGLAFSVPGDRKILPPTLYTMLKELEQDLHYPISYQNGDLTKWTKEGVLLWNAIPTCLTGKSLSHYEWSEWHYLTKEIVERLTEENIVVAALGGVAREFVKYADNVESRVIETSHPSPRAGRKSKTPFTGSRLFSTINAKLTELGKSPVDWRL